MRRLLIGLVVVAALAVPATANGHGQNPLYWYAGCHSPGSAICNGDVTGNEATYIAKAHVAALGEPNTVSYVMRRINASAVVVRVGGGFGHNVVVDFDNVPYGYHLTFYWPGTGP